MCLLPGAANARPCHRRRPGRLLHDLPEKRGEIDIQIGYLFDPKAIEEPLFDLLFDLLFEQVKTGVNFNVKDIWVDTMVQRGLRSRFAPRGPYSWQEETPQQFNRWLVKRYRSRAKSPA